MKLHKYWLNYAIVAALIIALSSGTFADTKKDKENKNHKVTENAASLMEVFEALSRIRVYVEFYFMESGEYPESLEQLNKDLNSLLPGGLETLTFPKDPATGKDFVYTPSKDQKTYTIAVPEPSKYGLLKLEFAQIPWGGFVQIAEERKSKFLQMITMENIKGIATAIEYYAKDNGGKFPAKLKDLIPKYIGAMPVCPVTGKDYIYVVEGDNYTVSSPNPEAHGMKELMFSSSRGWITR